MHPALAAWLRLRDYLSDDFLGGPKVVPLNWVINLQKGGTLPFVIGLMAAFDNFTPTAWTYAALHGSYGLIWLLKELVFPDVGWARKVTIAAAVNGFVLVLGLYWLAPILLISQRIEQPAAVLAAATFVYAVGVVLMVGSDAQKYFVLQQKKGLITNGFFARVRHPNYLGEMLLYGAFAVVAGHVVPWVVLAWIWGGLFIPNMLRKENSMKRHEGFAAYRARSGFLLPRLRRAPAPPIDIGGETARA